MGTLRVSDYVVTPLQAEPIALRSLPQLLEVMASLRQEGQKAQLIGAVLTMLQVRNKSSSPSRRSLGPLPTELLLDAQVLRDPTFLEASSLALPLAHASESPAQAAVFDQLAQELEVRMKLVTEGGDDGPIPLFA